jgi:hypothetical protein
MTACHAGELWVRHCTHFLEPVALGMIPMRKNVPSTAINEPFSQKLDGTSLMSPQGMPVGQHNWKMMSRMIVQPVCLMRSLPISYAKTYKGSCYTCSEGNVQVIAVDVIRSLRIPSVRQCIISWANISYSSSLFFTLLRI